MIKKSVMIMKWFFYFLVMVSILGMYGLKAWMGAILMVIAAVLVFPSLPVKTPYWKRTVVGVFIFLCSINIYGTSLPDKETITDKKAFVTEERELLRETDKNSVKQTNKSPEKKAKKLEEKSTFETEKIIIKQGKVKQNGKKNTQEPQTEEKESVVIGADTPYKFDLDNVKFNLNGLEIIFDSVSVIQFPLSDAYFFAFSYSVINSTSKPLKYNFYSVTNKFIIRGKETNFMLNSNQEIIDGTYNTSGSVEAKSSLNDLVVQYVACSEFATGNEIDLSQIESDEHIEMIINVYDGTYSNHNNALSMSITLN